VIAKQFDKIYELNKENPSLIDVCLYLEAIESYDKYPKGFWFIRKDPGNYLQQQLQLAKEYFKHKTEV
jgi:hypothetical protein